MNYINNITEAIGHTPLLKLNRVGKDAGANVFVKLEHLNPSGSYKDRMALAMVEAAERGDTWNGKKLDEGGTVVEASAGNTAPAVAMVCAAKGYKAKIFLYRYQLEGGKNTRMLITQAYGPQVGISSEPDVYLTPEQIDEFSKQAPDLLHVLSAKMDCQLEEDKTENCGSIRSTIRITTSGRRASAVRSTRSLTARSTRSAAPSAPALLCSAWCADLPRTASVRA